MEAIAGLLAFILMLVAFATGFFLLVVQPIWGIVDVAVSPRLSGVKAALIVLTLVLLGPLLTFFYAIFGSDSGGYRKATIGAAVIFVVSLVGVVCASALTAAVAPGDAGMQAQSAEIWSLD